LLLFFGKLILTFLIKPVFVFLKPQLFLSLISVEKRFEEREVNLFGRNTREEIGESGISEFTSTFFCYFAIADSEVELLILFEFS